MIKLKLQAYFLNISSKTNGRHGFAPTVKRRRLHNVSKVLDLSKHLRLQIVLITPTLSPLSQIMFDYVLNLFIVTAKQLGRQSNCRTQLLMTSKVMLYLQSTFHTKGNIMEMVNGLHLYSNLCNLNLYTHIHTNGTATGGNVWFSNLLKSTSTWSQGLNHQPSGK